MPAPMTAALTRRRLRGSSARSPARIGSVPDVSAVGLPGWFRGRLPGLAAGAAGS